MKLTDMPNIGSGLAKKLRNIGITDSKGLIETGSENAILKITTLENNGVCINMLYALEGAIQGIRWHNLSDEIKRELKDFFITVKKM